MSVSRCHRPGQEGTSAGARDHPGVSFFWSEESEIRFSLGTGISFGFKAQARSKVTQGLLSAPGPDLDLGSLMGYVPVHLVLEVCPRLGEGLVQARPRLHP